MSRKNNPIFCVPTEEEKRGLLIHLPDFPHENLHVTGMGTWMTSFHLQELIQTYKPTTIYHFGIAGAFNRSLKLGEVVEVKSEILADFGAEDRDGQHMAFHQIVSSINPDSKPWIEGELHNTQRLEHPDIRSVASMTVPFASGAHATIGRRTQLDVDLENMEGVGLFYTCLKKNIPFYSIRAISNYVEERNKNNWKIELALENLAKSLTIIYSSI